MEIHSRKLDLAGSPLRRTPLARLASLLSTRRLISLAASGGVALVAIAAGGLMADDASAVGDSRAISLYYTHTKDTLNITYKRNGYYDRDALKQLNYFLRDWRHDEPTEMDPKLFDVLWEVYREAGHEGETINVVSAYRSPETNAMLRRRSRAVAKFSQHMLGKAMDTTMPGVSMAHIREIGMRLQRGGVGYYPTAGTPFVHLDVGGVRAWPRMSTAQLVALFPDQKTVHLPSDGPPLAGYQEALAEIQRNGGSAGGGGEEEEVSGLSLLASLFGGGRPAQPTSSRAVQVASRSGGQQLAYARSSSDSDFGVNAFIATDGIAPKAESPLQPRGRTTRVKIENPILVASNAPDAGVSLGSQPAQTASPVVAAAPAPGTRSASPSEATPDLPQDLLASKEPAVPLPPRRPTDLLLASLPSNTPLPPERPAELAATSQQLQLASAEATQGRSSVPLPPILERPRIPQQALGYATTASVASFIPLPPLRGASSAQPQAPAVPLVPVNRGEARQASVAVKVASLAPTDTGARHAAGSKPPVIQVAALVRDGIVATRFEATPRLEAGRFSQGMTPALGAAFVKAKAD